MPSLRHVVGATVSVLIVALLVPPTAQAATAPTFASVQSFGTSATVTLNAYPGATSSLVCLRRTTKDASCTQQRTTTGTGPITFTGLTRAAASAPYDYVVRVTVTESSGRKVTSTNRVVRLLPPPTFASVQADGSSATVTLNPHPGATSSLVCLRRTTKDASCTQQRTTTGTGPITFTGLTRAAASAPYDYVVRVTVTESSGGKLTSTNRVVRLTEDPPARPTDIASTTTPSTATLTWGATEGATSYDVCIRRVRTDPGCDRRSPLTTATTFRFTSLTARAGNDYEYVVRAFGPGGRTNSTWQRLNMPVSGASTPTVTDTAATSVTLSWPEVWSAVTYRVEVSTSATMSSPRRTEVSSTSTTLTGLKPGTRYWVRVVGLNDDVAGRVSGTASRTLPTSPARVRVVTYNLCGQDKCLGSGRVTTWKNRKPYAGRLIRSTGAGIVSTQESGDKDTAFITELPGFRRARYLSGKSLFYDASLYKAQRSGDIVLDSKRRRYAVWVELIDLETRTPMIVVDPHLEPYKGKTNDTLRRTQTRTLLSAIDRVNGRDLPVVIAGDFNSNKDNANQSRYPGGFDGPAGVLLETGHLDARVNADRSANVLWNSANQAINPPLKYGDHVDQIWTTPDVLVHDWSVILDLASNGSLYRTPFARDHNPVRATVTIPGQPAGP